MMEWKIYIYTSISFISSSYTLITHSQYSQVLNSLISKLSSPLPLFPKQVSSSSLPNPAIRASKVDAGGSWEQGGRRRIVRARWTPALIGLLSSLLLVYSEPEYSLPSTLYRLLSILYSLLSTHISRRMSFSIDELRSLDDENPSHEGTEMSLRRWVLTLERARVALLKNVLAPMFGTISPVVLSAVPMAKS